jgi:rhomboid protease GluP
MWAAGIGRLLRTGNFTGLVTVACVALYILGLLLDPLSSASARRPSLFPGLSLFNPSLLALFKLGATGAELWAAGLWWTPLTAMYLHGDVLHILFNVLWIRQLGPAVNELYGQARLVVIFTLSGVLGFLVSNFVGVPFTIGASGAIFGLLGALIAYGRKRGGTLGTMVLREYGMWALILFAYGLLPGTSVNNWAHGGGFVGGFLAGLVLSFRDRRTESLLERVVAGGFLAMTALAFALASWTAFVS